MNSWLEFWIFVLSTAVIVNNNPSAATPTYHQVDEMWTFILFERLSNFRISQKLFSFKITTEGCIICFLYSYYVSQNWCQLFLFFVTQDRFPMPSLAAILKLHLEFTWDGENWKLTTSPRVGPGMIIVFRIILIIIDCLSKCSAI